MQKIIRQLAAEIKVGENQVKAAIELLDGGATVPFIARYRKEATDGLDDVQLRELEARLSYLRELEDRRVAVLEAIDEQGKLTPELRAAIEVAPTKQELEDLYLPFKQKRRTKGQIAREAGIEPLADKLLRRPDARPRRGSQGLRAAANAARQAGPRFLDCAAGARRRARHPLRTLGRRRCAGAGPARMALERRPAQVQPDGRQGREQRRRRQVPRLLRLRRADRPRALAPRAGGVPRPRARHPRRASWCCRWSPSPASPASPKAASRCTWAGAMRHAPPTT